MEIAKALAEKVSQQKIADLLGVSQSTVSRLANRDDVKAMIEKETIRFLGSVPKAIDNIADLVNEMPQITNVKEKELGFKASRNVLEAAGILISASPSLGVVNIVQRNSFVLSPVVQAMLDRFVESMKEAEPFFPPFSISCPHNWLSSALAREGTDGLEL
jgi:predicted transcriptional regulator